MGGFVHLELNTSDHKQAKKFYGKVFGWKYDDMKMPHGVYSLVSGKTPTGIGLQHAAMPDMPSSWIGYVEVEDVEKTVARAAKAGAEVTVPYFAVPGMGEGAWLVDPTGAPFAIWHSTREAPKQTGKKQTGKEKAGKKKAGKKKAGKQAGKKKAGAKKKSAKKPGKKKASKAKASKKQPARKKASKKKARKRR